MAFTTMWTKSVFRRRLTTSTNWSA